MFFPFRVLKISIEKECGSYWLDPVTPPGTSKTPLSDAEMR